MYFLLFLFLQFKNIVKQSVLDTKEFGDHLEKVLVDHFIRFLRLKEKNSHVYDCYAGNQFPCGILAGKVRYFDVRLGGCKMIKMRCRRYRNKYPLHL